MVKRDYSVNRVRTTGWPFRKNIKLECYFIFSYIKINPDGSKILSVKIIKTSEGVSKYFYNFELSITEVQDL